MEIIHTPKSKKQLTIKSDRHTHDTTLYLVPPTDEISLQDYEEFLLERLKLLQIIKESSEKGHVYFSKEWKEYIKRTLLNEKLNDQGKLIFFPSNKTLTDTDISRRKKDEISHWLLLTAFSSSEDKRQWFLQTECDLFKFKLSNETNFSEFISLNKLNYTPISNSQKLLIKDEFCNWKSLAIFEKTEFFKVKFTEVPDLVSDVGCILKNGYAYVPLNDFGSIACTLFKNALKSKIKIAQKNYDKFRDERVNHLLDGLNPRSAVKDFVEATDSISLNQLNTITKFSFPLCMRNLYDALGNENHLKYTGRRQLQLFLKGAGLSLEDCIQLFRQSFLKKIDDNRFEKEYVYSIRHNYGKVGNRINYKPWGCLSIISLPPPSQMEKHGCPFRTSDLSGLQKQLKRDGINVMGQTEIIDLVRSGHMQLACSKYFHYRHDNTSIGVNHPNEYFEESRKFYKNKLGITDKHSKQNSKNDEVKQSPNQN